MTSSTLAVVAIGRNEGERLRRCLTSLVGKVARIVYVDSGSRDGSVGLARDLGAEVVELDRSAPFTAARGRNAGFAALQAGGLPDYVQFVDGDCSVIPGWTDAGQAALDADPRLGIVTGWRSEVNRDASVYNQMCDVEWRRPAGEIRSCGGDMMVRSTAFTAVGGFNPGIIASEDEEFCLRVRAAGFTLRRLPVEMTRHDAAILSFWQWWQRNVRSGHGFAEVGGMHPTHFVAERRRVWAYAAMALLIASTAILVPWSVTLAMAIAVIALSWWRGTQSLIREGYGRTEARRHAIFYTLAKFPHLQGMLFYHWRRLRGQAAELIEYK